MRSFSQAGISKKMHNIKKSLNIKVTIFFSTFWQYELMFFQRSNKNFLIKKLKVDFFKKSCFEIKKFNNRHTSIIIVKKVQDGKSYGF